MSGETIEQRMEVFRAVSDAESLADHENEPFMLKNILTQVVEVVEEIDEATGLVKEEAGQYTRATLIAADGKAYSSGSKGIVNSVESILSIIGEPNTWPEAGIPFKMTRHKASKPGHFYHKLTLA